MKHIKHLIFWLIVISLVLLLFSNNANANTEHAKAVYQNMQEALNFNPRQSMGD